MNDLVSKIGENVFLQLAAFLVSVGLIGGSGYLLFQYNADRLGDREVVMQMESITNEMKVENDIMQIVADGWILNEDFADQLMTLLKYFSCQKCSRELDSTFKGYAIDWCNGSISQLSNEKARVGSYIVKDEIFKQRQAMLLRDYDVQINLVREIKSLAESWDTETLENRGQRFEEIADLLMMSRDSAAAMVQQHDQRVAAWNMKKSEIDYLDEKEMDRQRVRGVKLWGSLLGIAAGVGLILVTGMAVLRKPEKSKLRANRPDRIRKNTKVNRRIRR